MISTQFVCDWIEIFAVESYLSDLSWQCFRIFVGLLNWRTLGTWTHMDTNTADLMISAQKGKKRKIEIQINQNWREKKTQNRQWKCEKERENTRIATAQYTEWMFHLLPPKSRKKVLKFQHASQTKATPDDSRFDEEARDGKKSNQFSKQSLLGCDNNYCAYIYYTVEFGSVATSKFQSNSKHLVAEQANERDKIIRY